MKVSKKLAPNEILEKLVINLRLLDKEARTAVSTLSGTAHMFMAGAYEDEKNNRPDGMPSPKTIQAAKRILYTSEQVGKLVTDFALHASLLASHANTRLQPVAIRPLLEQVTEQAKLHRYADQKHLDIQLVIEPETASELRADPRYLRDILERLIENARVYTPNRGSVKITASPAPDTAQTKIAIADTGMGIHATDFNSIFDLFFRSAQARAKHPHGTGTSLAICDLLMQTMQGEIAFDSLQIPADQTRSALPLSSALPPQTGTIVTVTLPCIPNMIQPTSVVNTTA